MYLAEKLNSLQYNQTLNKTFLDDQNVTMNFNELKTHCKIATATPVPWLNNASMCRSGVHGPTTNSFGGLVN